MDTETRPIDDEASDFIASHGGPSATAKLLGYDPSKGGAQRVNNWRQRGIPARVKLEFPHLFLRRSNSAK